LLGVSLTSNECLRWYSRCELWPSIRAIVQNLLWGELWRHVWEFVLHPFPTNVLIPTRNCQTSQVDPFTEELDTNNDNFNSLPSGEEYISSYASDLWYRVHNRIDKMTSSLLKKSVEKTVRSSLGQFFPNVCGT
jgi:hypothetical protein